MVLLGPNITKITTKIPEHILAL